MPLTTTRRVTIMLFFVHYYKYVWSYRGCELNNMYQLCCGPTSKQHGTKTLLPAEIKWTTSDRHCCCRFRCQEGSFLSIHTPTLLVSSECTITQRMVALACKQRRVVLLPNPDLPDQHVSMDPDPDPFLTHRPPWTAPTHHQQPAVRVLISDFVPFT